jgi:transcriptional regulator with XRE-family HTH domain
MEVNIDRHFIRSERERRAWSQEHLATVADLGVRTIQRIEATGLASYESAKAIAGAFEMPVSEIVPAAPIRKSWYPELKSRSARATAAIAASVLAAASLLIGQAVLAKDVMLNVGFTLNDEQKAVQLLTAEGKDAELLVSGQFRLVVVPTIKPDGHVLLTMRLYEHDGRDLVRVAQPVLLAKNNQEAAFQSVSDRGDKITVVITPHVQ